MTKFSTKLNIRNLSFDQGFLLEHEIHDDRKIQLKVEPPNLLVWFHQFFCFGVVHVHVY